MNGTKSLDLRERESIKEQFITDISNMLKEKANTYGERGGFYKTNKQGNYSHALGEAGLKLDEFKATRTLRCLVKVATWVYLIYETEVLGGSR